MHVDVSFSYLHSAATASFDKKRAPQELHTLVEAFITSKISPPQADIYAQNSSYFLGDAFFHPQKLLTFHVLSRPQLTFAALYHIRANTFCLSFLPKIYKSPCLVSDSIYNLGLTHEDCF
jgi:hypothetical protein